MPETLLIAYPNSKDDYAVERYYSYYSYYKLGGLIHHNGFQSHSTSRELRQEYLICRHAIGVVYSFSATALLLSARHNGTRLFQEFFGFYS